MYAFLLGGGATKGFLIKLFDPEELSPPGLKGATGGAALLNAAIRSRNEPPLGFSETGGGEVGLDEAGIGLGAEDGGENSAALLGGDATTFG